MSPAFTIGSTAKVIAKIETKKAIESEKHLEEIVEASDGIIRVKEARYYTFGAGMPTEADQPTWEFSYAEDGAIVVTGITYTYDSLNYIVGTVHDHYLTIHGECINLRELCGRNAKIEIYQQK